ncbi:hypothetical protein E2C01_065248 [Portunus trituberculatus]|uniref:Uncharacterized protein n=1 Tax=Portunus trituberculatus TaxID=210409 RepID=A0A5B7HDZ8_PORTR|nr:hypothetical protein [Portunus trituberculatus]
MMMRYEEKNLGDNHHQNQYFVLIPTLVNSFKDSFMHLELTKPYSHTTNEGLKREEQDNDTVKI